MVDLNTTYQDLKNFISQQYMPSWIDRRWVKGSYEVVVVQLRSRMDLWEHVAWYLIDNNTKTIVTHGHIKRSLLETMNLVKYSDILDQVVEIAEAELEIEGWLTDG